MEPRHKESGVFPYPTVTVTEYKQPVGGSKVLYSGPYERRLAYSRSYYDGWDIPSFHARKKRGELLPQTAFSQFEVDFAGSGSWDWTNTSPNPDVRYWYEPAYIYSDESVTDVTVRAGLVQFGADFNSYVQAAAAKIYQNQGHDSLTFILELKKTIHLFTKAGKTLSDLLRRGKLADTWLQYRYGWRILYFDLVGISKAIDNLNSERKRYSETVGESFSTSSTATANGDFAHVNRTIRTNYAWNLSVRGNVVADIEPPSFRFNPAITAWELISYSFVIDWFVEVGQWLAAMSFLAFANRYSAAYGYKLSMTKQVLLENISADAGWTMNSAASSWIATAHLTERVPTSVPFRLSTNFRVPEALKILDLLALLLQRVRR